MIGEREQLILDEGLRLFPYRCTAGKITIGVGRNLEDNPLTAMEVIRLLSSRPHINVTNIPISEVRRLLLEDFYAKGITREEAYFLLDNDIKKFSLRLIDALPWVNSAPVEVQRILLNMAFNMGISNLLTFENTLKEIKQGNYKQAAENMKKSKWAKQVTNRAGRLIERMAKI